ncbi:hypothetical protein B0H14DRAFT_2611380 [Mycena olivaceomarginata]|nr:hypothetical protein B0H14DRAFT_2611380 [Mycena olivaceomarginata]
MDRKAHKHSEPHTNPEIRTLLKVYQDTELLRRGATRQIDDRDTDDFARGIKKLCEGALQNAIAKSAANRQVFRTDTPPSATISSTAPDTSMKSDTESLDEDSSDESSSSESDSDSDSEGRKWYATRGSIHLVDGELVFDERDMLLGPEDEEYQEEDASDNDN